MAPKDEQISSLSSADLSTLVQSIAKMANQTENGPVRQVSVAKAKYCTPWNPTGEKKRPKLKRPTYMSGARLREIMLSSADITLLNQLKAGKYNQKRWVVTERDGGAEGSAIDVMIPNKTMEDRIRLKGEAFNLNMLLTKIVAEQHSLAA